MTGFERRLNARALRGGVRLRVAQAVTATLLADMPLACVMTFCDFVLPDDGVAVASRNTLAVRQLGPTVTAGRTDLTTEDAGDIVDVAASAAALAVTRGNGFQVTRFVPSPSSPVAVADETKTWAAWDTHAVQVVSIAVAQSGVVATGCVDGTIGLWPPAAYEVDSGVPRTTHPLLIVGHADWVRSLTFLSSEIGQLLLASAGDDGKVAVWDAHSGACLHRAVFPAHALKASAACDGVQPGPEESVVGALRWDLREAVEDSLPACPRVAVAIGAEAIILLWRDKKLTPACRFSPHAVPVTTMALWRGGAFLATASEDEEVAVHTFASGVPKRLFCTRPQLAARLCASLVAFVTRVVILHAPPESTAIVVVCTSSDGDLITFTAFPSSRDTLASDDLSGHARSPASPTRSASYPSTDSSTNNGPGAPTSMLDRLLRTTGGSSSTHQMQPTTASQQQLDRLAAASGGGNGMRPQAEADKSVMMNPPGGGPANLYRTHMQSMALETGAVVAMARCGIHFA